MHPRLRQMRLHRQRMLPHRPHQTKVVPLHLLPPARPPTLHSLKVKHPRERPLHKATLNTGISLSLCSLFQKTCVGACRDYVSPFSLRSVVFALVSRSAYGYDVNSEAFKQWQAQQQQQYAAYYAAQGYSGAGAAGAPAQPSDGAPPPPPTDAPPAPPV